MAAEVRTRIKVCGITRAADAHFLAAAGVDALGFIFAAKSPRRVSPEQARDIIRGLPPFVAPVGVFVDATAAEVAQIAAFCRLAAVQLHGSEPPELCRALARPVVKAIRVGPHTRRQDLVPYLGAVAGLLFDTYQPGQAGGTGLAFDWSRLADLAPPLPWILAGGLAPANVGPAVARLHPYGVDLNSGVEQAPGIKDPALALAALAAIRQADLAR
ncbi:MAG: phosphoribosylanthranilate isomerase [Thermodesulfobacteriota bacterium]